MNDEYLRKNTYKWGYEKKPMLLSLYLMLGIGIHIEVYLKDENIGFLMMISLLFKYFIDTNS